MLNRHAFRAKFDDYNEGLFFITVCTFDKTHDFGYIQSGKIHLSEIGKALADAINYAHDNYTDVKVINSVIMPNHWHAIISIDSYASSASSVNMGAIKPKMHPGDDYAFIPHFNARLAVVVRTIKAAVKREATRMGVNFRWQERFHDHIIRNQQAFDNIYNYIDNNILKWDTDCFNQ